MRPVACLRHSHGNRQFQRRSARDRRRWQPGAATLAEDRPFTLTMTANDAKRAYGSANPVFTGTLTGVRNSDGMTATYNTTANASSRRFLSDHRDLADRITNWAITTWSTVPAS